MRGCIKFLLDLWTAYHQCYVAKVDKSNPRRTTAHSASDYVFANLFEIFIDQMSDTANLENVVPIQVP